MRLRDGRIFVGLRQLRLRQLEAFQQVMRTGSVTRAGEAMGVSQPGVSRLLSELERHVGFRLFERRGTRIYPTPEAVRFLRHVERSFVGLEALERAADEIANARGAELRVAAFPAVSLNLLPGCIAKFNSIHPETRVSATVTNSPRVAELAAMLEVELGVTTLPVIQGSLAIAHQVSLPCVCALPLGHRLSAAETVRAADLSGERLVALDPGFATSRGLQTSLARARVEPHRVVDISFSYAACEMVRHGSGVAIVDPLTALAFDCERVVFRPFSPSVRFSFGIVRAAHGPASLVSQSMLGLLVRATHDLPRLLKAKLRSGKSPDAG